ncbi:MAG: type VI secretion system contractile sheath large subunit [Thermoguttaceae bacterium]
MSSGVSENQGTVQTLASSQPVGLPAVSAAGESLAGLLDALVTATRQPAESLRPLVEEFLQECSPQKALTLWVRLTTAPGRTPDKQQILRALARTIATLDELLARQVNAILHHPRFQKLEAAWRGLRYLVDQLDDTQRVKIRVLNVTWRELARDAERAIEFDQSQLFRKVYSEEFDTPGGEPFSVLLGDYEVQHRVTEGHPVDDMAVLKAISGVAAAAFAPFIAAAHPAMFGLNDFSSLEQPLHLSRTFDQLEYLKWEELRRSEDSRFLGLTLPRVLMRLPYEDDGSRLDGFRFREDVSGPGREKYLWGSAVYAFGAVLIRAFSQSGWLADIRGVRRDVAGGGVVCGLPVHSFATDRRGIAPKSSTEVILSDRQEGELSHLGFIPLCHCPDTELAAFYTNQSVHKPKTYDDPAATMNARISAMLRYTLCVSRFAHYLKAIARDKMGAFTEPELCADYLYRWLQRYVTPDSEASAEVKARLPLREARVEVTEHPAKPGSYRCTAHLWPHFELDELTATLKVTTELTAARSP